MTVQPIDMSRTEGLQEILLSKAMPPGSLGDLARLAIRIALITPRPLTRLTLLLFAGDHGIVAEGITHSPQEITAQQSLNFAKGGGACGLFARCNGVDLSVVDMGVNHRFLPSDGIEGCKLGFGTRNFLHAKAMDTEQCTSAMERGKALVRKKKHSGFDCIAFGEMGVGNTSSASAIASAITGLPVRKVTGKGSGLSDEDLEHKCTVLEQALSRHSTRDPLEVLASFGGFEIAAIAGAIIEAASLGMPILLDGFITTAAALVSCALEPACRHYIIACHLSAIDGHDLLLEYLGLPAPVLSLGMQLGEGTGALTAWPIISQA
ncbi:MAG: nicotinate-nucleotide--dimethylbenzimidazole phosphoribosyltransferase, partial [Sphaerochaeta sp.]|nr:nicotinate-nucleotide--dimethylbenzimidazole phosphoribosyltransferase [Sphaerochaeta sp.]